MSELLIVNGNLSGAFSQIHQIESKLLDRNFISHLPNPVQNKLSEIELDLQEVKGKLYTHSGNYQESINNFVEAKKRFSTIYHDQLGLGRIYAQLGYVYYLTNQMEKALKFLNKALEIFSETDNNNDIFSTLFRKGLVVIAMNNSLDPILSEMKTVIQQIDFKKREYLIMYLKAWKLFSSNDISEKYLARNKFEELLKEDLPFYLELNLQINILKIELIDLTVLHSQTKEVEFFDRIDGLIDVISNQSQYHFILELNILRMTYYILNQEIDVFYQNYEKIKAILEGEKLEYLIKRLYLLKDLCDHYIENSNNCQLSPLFSFLFEKIKITMTPGLKFERKPMSQNELINPEEFDPLLHPDRMTMIHLLMQKGNLTKLDIHNITEIPKSTIYRQLDYLIERRLVDSEMEFRESRPVRAYSITPDGIHLLQSLKMRI